MAFCVGMAPDVEDPSSFFFLIRKLIRIQWLQIKLHIIQKQNCLRNPESCKSELNSNPFQPFHVPNLVSECDMSFASSPRWVWHKGAPRFGEQWLRTVFLFFWSQEDQWNDMDVSENGGFPPKSAILVGFSIINHPCWGTPIFGNTHICCHKKKTSTSFLHLNI